MPDAAWAEAPVPVRWARPGPVPGAARLPSARLPLTDARQPPRGGPTLPAPAAAPTRQGSTASLPLRIGFLASHGGSSMRTIVAAIRDGRLSHTIPAVAISNNSQSPALAFARESGIPTYHLSDHTHPDPEALDSAILAALRRHEATLVILSGYMRKIGSRTLAAYEGRILNIHPALLPDFGGKGMYGDRVHAAVLAAQAPVSGATVHLVDAEYDHGRTLAQHRVPVLPDDTVQSLGDRVRAAEGPLYVHVLRAIADGTIALDG